MIFSEINNYTYSIFLFATLKSDLKSIYLTWNRRWS